MSDSTLPLDVLPLDVLPLDLVKLVDSFHSPLYRYAYRLTGSVADAEDLTQQVFLVAQQKLEQVRDVETVRGWLFTVLRNCYLKGFRQRIPLPLTSCDLDVNDLPDLSLGARIDSEELQGAINTLPDEFKVVILMFYFEQRSYKAIAEELKIPLGTVMSRLSRAKSHLRHQLEEPLGSNGSADRTRQADGTRLVTTHRNHR